jgi:hypothetical protein
VTPPGRRTRLVLILVPVLGGFALALTLSALGASDGVSLVAGLSPLVIVIALFVWISIGSRHEIQAFAAQHGWSYDGTQRLPRLARGAPFTGLSRNVATTHATGEWNARTYRAFQYAMRRSGGRSGVVVPFTCVMTVLGTEVPFVNIAKRARFSPSTDPSVGTEVRLRIPGFDHRMRVRSEDEGFVRALLTPEVRALVEGDRELTVRVDGTLALALSYGTPTVDLLERLLARLDAFATAVEAVAPPGTLRE